MNFAEYVIVGGGLAGLCAAKRLIELGCRPLVIEAGDFPSHKVCGEFISPHALTILKSWDLHPLPIDRIRLHASLRNLEFILPKPAGSLSHLTLDSELAQQIVKAGGSVLTKTSVLNLSPSVDSEGLHTLSLSSGEKISARHLFIAVGKLAGQNDAAQKKIYYGFKAHFTCRDFLPHLNMYLFPGAYLGAVPVENHRVNIACLARADHVEKESSPQIFMDALIKSHPHLSELLQFAHPVFDQWMVVKAPKFGQRQTPNWPRTYWIGDAQGAIPPASGNGLSLAIASGRLAAECAVKDDPDGFREIWNRDYSSFYRVGKCLNSLFLSPFWSGKALYLGQKFPILATTLFEKSRQK